MPKDKVVLRAVKVYIKKLAFANTVNLFLVFDEVNWHLLKSATSSEDTMAKFLAVFGSERMLTDFAETDTIETSKTLEEAFEEMKCKSA